MGYWVSFTSCKVDRGIKVKMLVGSLAETYTGRNADIVRFLASRTQSPSSAVASSFSTTPGVRSARLCPRNLSARSNPPLLTLVRSLTATTMTTGMMETRRSLRRRLSAARLPSFLYFATPTRLQKPACPLSLR
jgi:hypothetical protein